MYAPNNDGPLPDGKPPGGPSMAVQDGRLRQARPPVPTRLTEAPNAASLVKALRRRCGLALSLGIICATAAGLATWLIVPPSKYTARALFRVASDAPRVIFPTSEGKVDLDTYQKTQVAMIKSRKVLEKALGRVESDKASILNQLNGDPVEWLEKALRVVPSGEMLGITLAGNNPDDVQNIVNAVADAYTEEVVDKEKEAREARRKDLQSIYDEYQTRLKEKRKILRETAEEIGSNDKQVQIVKHQLELERLSVAERELMGVESELRRANAELVLKQAADPGLDASQSASAPPPEIPGEALDRWLAQDQTTLELREQMEQVASRVAHLRSRIRDTADPAIQRPLGELASIRLSLARRREQVLADLRTRSSAPDAQTPPVGAGAPIEDRGHRRIEAKIAMLQELRKSTVALVEKLRKETKDLSRLTSGHESLQDEIAHADNAAKKIGNELEILNVELEAPSRVLMIERAGRPRREDERGPLKMAALASLFAFALVLTGVSWFEFRARRVGAVDDVSDGLGMKVVGTLPHMPRRARGAKAHTPASLDPAWDRLMIESVDAARALLLHAARTESHRVMMVTSALGGEGKTSLACHISTSLARAGRRTLLVDCDLRRPATHRVFEVEAEPGFCDYLRGEAALADLIRPTHVQNLSIIPAGRGDAVAIQALAHEKTWEGFDWMRQGYDFVVVDSAPILSVADSLAISQCVDAVIFSILRDVSRLPRVYAAHAQLTALGVRTIGAIVTGTHREAYDTDYGAAEG